MESIKHYQTKTDMILGHADLYQINHIALMNFFKSFKQSNPHLTNEDGRLDIEYQNKKIKL